MEATNQKTLEKALSFVLSLEDCPAKDALYTAVRDVLLDYIARASVSVFLDDHPEFAEKTNVKKVE
jgi:hypothetical protein